MQELNRKQLPRVKALVLAIHAAIGGAAWALPQDATIVNGAVTMNRATPGSLLINASNGSIINWKQFSIGASETTRFIQPSSSSAVLNRVTGPDVSQLLGQLKANGNVFLINPNGILVGGGARIDTNNFIASTLDIADSDFLAGKLRFFAGSAAGKIRNDGMITAGPGGRIALIAPDIENTGIIRAQDGNILLAAGRKLEIASLDLEGVTFEIQAPTDSVLNLGKLLAENGAVRAFAGSLRHSGEIRASRLVRDADGSIVLAGSNDVTLTSDSITSADGLAGGTIVVQSRDGTTRVSGALSASGSSGAGGDIRVLGQRVALDAGAALDVSGSSGGGQILVGGDFQGSNPDVQNAQRVYVAEGASLKADATVQGDGGRVIVWADENTRYHGALSAQGGVLGGDGGFAEVSGKANLEFAGTARLGASLGASGSLLLDPLDILVSATSGILPIVVDEFADFSSNIVTVSPATLAAVAGNVTLQAERDIYIKDAIALTTAGAGLTATAGGATYNAGSIFNTAGISTAAGAVTLRAQAISGGGGISTSGGAVDLLTRGNLNYSGPINTGGGSVTLASATSAVTSANVNAGSGAITVTGQTGVSGGSYTTTGSASFTATTGSLSIGDINAAVANLNAPSSVNATVSVTDRVNASSTNSSVQITGDGSGPLRLGTLTSGSGIYLYSSTGMTQAAGGLLTTPFAYFETYNSLVETGSVAAPISLAAPSALVQPRVQVFDMAAPAHFALSGSPTLAELSLAGHVTALGGTTLTGAANLTSLALSSGSGVLNVAATSSAGFGNGFKLNVNDGAINASTLTLPGGAVDLRATGAVTVGDMAGGSLFVAAKGAVSIGTATTTGSSGISVQTQSCVVSNVACGASSPITAGTLVAGGTGDISLATYDNGNLTVTSMTAGDDITLEAGRSYPTAFGYPYTSQRTTNSTSVGTAVSGGRFSANNSGQGDLTVTSLSAGDRVTIQAGGSFSPSYNVNQYTTNNISVGNVAVAGATDDFSVTNNGIGNIGLTGNIDQSVSGDISVSTYEGAVTSTGNLTARDSITVAGGRSGAVTLARVTAGTPSSNGQVTLSAYGNLLFESVSATAVNTNSGNVSLVSTTGSIKTSLDSTALDVSASGNVTMTASHASNGVIGDGAFTNPLNVKAGAAKSVSLVAGSHIGASGAPVTVDTGGTLVVSSANGQFHVAATDGTTAKSLSTIRLTGSAAGIGAGNDSTLTSLDLNVTAASDGSTITVGDLVRSTGTLNEFSFTANNGSALVIGNVDLSTSGFNQLLLSATNGVAQASPVTTDNVSAGYINIAGGGAVTLGNVTASTAVGNSINITGSDITTGNLAAPSLTVSGDNLVLGTVTTSGTHRGYYTGYDFVARLGAYDYVLDEARLTASGDISTSGDITSQTSALVNAGGNVTVGGGTGLVTAGGTTVCCTYYTDTARVVAGSGSGSIQSGAISAYNVDLQAATIDVGNVQANLSGGSLQASGVDIGTGTLSGYNIVLDGTNLTTGTITGTYVNLSGASFNTGDITAGTNLTIDASASFAPSNLAMVVTSGTASITAAGDIDIATANGSSLSAAAVNLVSTAGNVSAALTGTTNLTIDTAIGFDVSTTAWLTNLNVTAQWDQATGAPSSVGSDVRSVTASGSQQFDYSFDGPLLFTVSSLLHAGRAWNVTYHDVSPNPIGSDVEASVSHGGTGTVSLTFDSATSFRNTSVSLPGGASVRIQTGGDVDLSNVATLGGFVDVNSWGGTVNLTSVSTGGGSVSAYADQNIHVDSVATLGGDVFLESGSGSILRAGAQPLQIDTRDGNGFANGTVTLRATGGSIGSSTGPTPILVSGAVSLNLAAMDDIAVDVLNTSLTNLSIATGASGAGQIAVSDANFSSLDVTRSAGTELVLTGLNPSSPGAFSLTATDGNLRVADNIANVTDLTLNASSGTVDISAAGLAAARTVAASGQISISAGQDILVTAGSAATESVSVTGGSLQLDAGQDIRVVADGGSALLSASATSVYSQSLSAGRDLVLAGGATTNASAQIDFSGSGLSYVYIDAGRDLLISGGAGTDASASLSMAGSLSYARIAAGRDMSVGGGAGSGAFAALDNADTYQQTLVTGRDLWLHGGTGQGAYAKVHQASLSTGYQYATVGGNLSVLGGDASSGQGTGAYAELSGDRQSMPSIQGQILVAGGTAADNSALFAAAFDQSLGTNYRSSGYVTDALSVLGGAGDRAFARVSAGTSQTILVARDGNNGAATGNILVTGGGGADASAEIAAGSSQTLGSQDNYCYYYGCYDPTHDLVVTGGAGAQAFASVHAVGDQYLSAGGAIQVLGGAGATATAELRSTSGSQYIGSTSTSSTDATDAIRVEAGAGGIARILAQAGNQEVMAGADLSVLGGSGAGMTASIEATLGSQSIGYTYTASYSNDPSGAVTVRGGTASGAAAWIKAHNSQTIDAGGAIVLAGGVDGAFAEVSTSNGSQSIGNFNQYYTDPTDSITLTGGSAAGSYAMLSAGTSQNVRSLGAIQLAGGVGDGSGARMTAVSGQTVAGAGSLAITGGSGTTPGGNDSGLTNSSSGTQNLSLSGSISVTGGGSGSDTGIYNTGTGLQSITSGGSLSVLAPAGTPNADGSVSIESGTGGQVINVTNGSVSVNNAGALAAYISSDGAQTITTRSMAISLSSPVSLVTGPLAAVSAVGNQTLNLNGDGVTAGTATLSVVNLSGQTGSVAALSSDGNQTIQMDYDAAGLVKIGDSAGQGMALVSAGGSHTMVAGALWLQGGQTAASTASLVSAQNDPLVGDMVISTLYGPVQLIGGSAGGAFIDPPLLSITSNGSVLLQAGTNGTSSTNINAGQFNLAATAGDLSLLNSTTSAATATITANSFNFSGPGGVILTGGTVTVTTSGSVDIGGVCVNCTTNLIGPFSIRAYVPPPVPPIDYGALVNGDLVSLTELVSGPVDMVLDENGIFVSSRRRLNQCY